MATPKAPKQGVITLALKTKNELFSCYMPFLKNGGLFVPTNRGFELGDEVFLLLTLMDDPQRHPVTGKVIWITPRASGNKPVGIGIQFSGNESVNVQKKIETHLAGAMQSDRPTCTM
jgi:type IV pilus assembly protein PilZ